MVPGAEKRNKFLERERKRSMTYYSQFMRLISFRRKSMITHSEMAEALMHMHQLDSTVHPATVEELAQLESDVNHGLSPVANSYIRVMGMALSMFGDPNKHMPKLLPGNSLFLLKMHDIKSNPATMTITKVTVKYVTIDGQESGVVLSLTANDSTTKLIDALISIGEKAQLYGASRTKK